MDNNIFFYKKQTNRSSSDLKVRKSKFLSIVEENIELKQTIEDLKTANGLIIEQQEAAISKERLTLLLQMAGAIAHDLNQPLMALLGNIELLKLMGNDNDKMKNKYFSRIEQAGQRISDSVKKIQNIRQDATIQHDSKSIMINLEQRFHILLIQRQKNDCEKLQTILKNVQHINLITTKNISKAMLLLENVHCDLIISEFKLTDGTGLDLLTRLNKLKHKKPVIVIIEPGEELNAAALIKAGAFDCIPKDAIDHHTILKRINNAFTNAEQKSERGYFPKDKISGFDSQALMYNRLYFMESLEREMERVKRNSSNLVLYMLTMNQFNDADPSFSKYGLMLKDCLRKSDLICRYSHTEFGIILSDTTLEKATAVSNRIKKSIAKTDTEDSDSMQAGPNYNLGVSFYNDSTDKSPVEMIASAKQATFLIQ